MVIHIHIIMIIVMVLFLSLLLLLLLFEISRRQCILYCIVYTSKFGFHWTFTFSFVISFRFSRFIFISNMCKYSYFNFFILFCFSKLNRKSVSYIRCFVLILIFCFCFWYFMCVVVYDVNNLLQISGALCCCLFLFQHRYETFLALVHGHSLNKFHHHHHHHVT